MDLAEELSGKMVDVNVKLKRLEELVALSISNEGEEERPYQLLDELEGWKLNKKDLETDLYKYSLQRLLLPISWCEKVLGIHERYVSKNFEIRYENLLKKLEEPGELPEYIPEYAVNEMIAEKLIATTKAFLGEFKQELQNESQNTRRKTLVQSLQEQHEQSIEWNNLNEKLIYVGIQISKVLVKFLVSMAGSDLKIQDLKTKIESLAYVYNKEQKSVVIDKFLNVVDITSNIMSMSEKKLKAELAFGAFEEEELEKIIFDSIMDLDFIWNGLSMTVPESSDMLAGALLRAQNMIGQILYNIHGVKVRIPEEKDERWKTFKVIIGQLWKGEQGQEG